MASIHLEADVLAERGNRGGLERTGKIRWFQEQPKKLHRSALGREPKRKDLFTNVYEIHRRCRSNPAKDRRTFCQLRCLKSKRFVMPQCTY
jgi:hypothetical protein